MAESTPSQDVVVPGGHGAAMIARPGQLLTIVDWEGEQVADFVAFSEHSQREWLSTVHTRSATLRLNLAVGDTLESNWRNPMFEVIQDDVGVHDVITSMCDERRYLIDYGVVGHRSCRSNLAEAFEPWDIDDWQIPDPFNLFQNAPIRSDRTFGNERPTSRAGDKIVLRVLMAVLVGVSACPQDLNACNGYKPSPIHIQLTSDGIEEE